MLTIKKVIISQKLIEYLQARKLEKQYFKAKEYTLSGNGKNIDLKLREPKSEKIWYFRINKQFRAAGKMQ